MTTLGEVIDSRGLTIDMDDNDIITDIIVLAEVVTLDGDKFFVMTHDENGNWLKEYGLLSAVHKKVSDGL